MMERRSGVALARLPAWEDCAISLPEVALHHHRREPPQVPLRELYANGHSGARCVSPREVGRWAEAVGSASVGSMVVSLKEVMDAGEWHSSPTPSTVFSSSSSRSSTCNSESDLSETGSVDDEPTKRKKAASAKKGSSKREKSNNKLHKAKGAIYGKEDGKRILHAATFERIVQWIINKEVRHAERASTPRGNTPDQGSEEQSTTATSPRGSAPEVEVSAVGRAFIGAYRQHASPERLLSLVAEFYRNPPKRGKRTTPQEKQRNCVYFLGAWMEEAFTRDFYRCVHKAQQPPANSRCLKKLLGLLTHVAESYPVEVNRVKLTMLRKANEAPRPPSPLPEYTKKEGTSAGRPDVLTWDLTELAEQMTLMESSMFTAIQPREFHKLAWRKNDTRKKTSPHIVAVVERFNTVSYWVASSIVMCNDIKKRVTMVKRFVKLAEVCRDLRNFSTLMAVLAGLNNSAVRRLKLTWQGVNETTKQSLEALDVLMENKANYKQYRDLLLKEEFTTAPVVPYLGLYLRDLTFIDEGNADRADELINFEKLVMQGDIILQIAKWQQNGRYDFKPDPERQLSLTKLLVLPEDILYKKSEAIEPSSLPHTQL